MKPQGKRRSDSRYVLNNWKESMIGGELLTTVDIVDQATGNVVDKLFIDGLTAKSWTKSGKSLDYYEL